MKKKNALIVVVAAMFILSFASYANNCCECKTVTLYAGRSNVPVGTVTICNDADSLYITYNTENGWVLCKTYVITACSYRDIPQLRRRPNPCEFPIQTCHDPMTTEYTYTLDIPDCGRDCIYISVHAEVAEVCGDGCGSPQWASSVIDDAQGILVGGGTITDPGRTDPTAALGAPDDSFFSLGFGGGYIELAFDNPIYNGPGPDIKVYETTYGRGSYPEEKADVYVISGGDEIYAGEVSNKDPGGVGQVSIPEDICCIDGIKIVDDTDPGLFENSPNADAYDLDAVGVCWLCCDQEHAYGARMPAYGGYNTFFCYCMCICEPEPTPQPTPD